MVNVWEQLKASVELVLRWLKLWKQQSSSFHKLCDTAAKWRAMFSRCLEAVGLAELSFRAYSLRRGGATRWFSKHGSLDRVVVQGRWQAQRTARMYINAGLAVIAEMAIPRAQLKPFFTIFRTGSLTPRFA